MEQQRRLLIFFTLSLAILLGWTQVVIPLFFPLPPAVELEEPPVSALLPENSPLREPVVAAPTEIKQVEHPAKSVIIGSEADNSPFFMAVELTSLGGAVNWIKLNDPRYPEIGARGTPLTLVGHDTRQPLKTFATDVPKLTDQLQGKSLEEVHWELIGSSSSTATFAYTVPDGSLRITKQYSLEAPKPPAGVSPESFRDTYSPGYQLKLVQLIENLADRAQPLQYTLRGPVGLPLEDPHNSSKHNEVRMGFLREGGAVDHSKIAAATVLQQERDQETEIWKRAIQYIGVDTQYFAALVHPLGDQLKSPTVEASQAVLLAERGEDRFADISVLLTSVPRELKAKGSASASVSDEFVLFAGPKREELLEPLEAESVLDYGWFAPLVRVMLAIVHALRAFGLSYGLAIIGLTCLVRAALIPLTLHQARSMDKMKELQPKIKTLHEKYKKDPQSLSPEEMRQMQEVNLKMFAGCLPLFAQMPIFIALYRALQVSVDLRMAPFHLFGNWIDNLASPDALFALGFALPFVGWTEFNLLPLLSIGLMQINQKLTMPPPADEEQAMQYRMMNIMMYVMVVFFYRVPAGLCLYFIMSSLWGTTERLLMKRLNAAKAAKAAAAGAVAIADPGPSAAKPARGTTEIVPAAPTKPSFFDEVRRQFRELQEKADKEGQIRRDSAQNANRPEGKKGKKDRGRS